MRHVPKYKQGRYERTHFDGLESANGSKVYEMESERRREDDYTANLKEGERCTYIYLDANTNSTVVR